MFSSQQIKDIGSTAAQGLTFEYGPRPVIETLKPRQLWLLGAATRKLRMPELNLFFVTFKGGERMSPS